MMNKFMIANPPPPHPEIGVKMSQRNMPMTKVYIEYISNPSRLWFNTVALDLVCDQHLTRAI